MYSKYISGFISLLRFCKGPKECALEKVTNTVGGSFMKNFAMVGVVVATLGVSSIALADSDATFTDINNLDLNSLMDASNAAVAVKPGTKADAIKAPSTEDPSSSSLIFGSDLGYSMSDAPVGQSYLPIQNAFTVFSNKKSGGLAFGAHLGYRYAVIPSLLLGVEFGYLNLSKTSISASKIDVNNHSQKSYKYSIRDQLITTLATVDYRIASHYDVFAKFGPALVLQKSVFNFNSPLDEKVGINLSTSVQHYKVKPFLSVGAGYAWDQFEFAVAYDHLFANAPTNQDVQRKFNNYVNFTDIKNKIFTQSAVMGSIGYALPI